VCRGAESFEMSPTPRVHLSVQRAIALFVSLASFAAAGLGPASALRSDDTYSADERAHWSLAPPAKILPPVPASQHERGWVRGPVDAFILERLERAKLAPAPEATRNVLIRRLALDLTGLPPTPEEIKSFRGDSAPDAYERLVDRLLADPAYGEHWGQHWLDVVRYAESEGFEYDRHRPGAWRYRDYVIRSFNLDKPYDQFVLEQIAGDEVPEGGDDALVAAGFHRLGAVRRNAGNSDVAFSRNEVLTEMTDAIGLVFLGLTVGCARCHDHMFDPIRQRDYYSLQAFLAATHEHDIPLGEADVVANWRSDNDRAQEEIKRLRALLDDAAGPDRERLTQELKAAQKRVPAPLPTISSVHNDMADRALIHVLERGQTERPGEAVAPRALGVMLQESAPALSPEIESPKRYLAQWIASPENPLAARVLVNRLWHYNFGRGIVATPNDFGVAGSGPSHERLLDYLANELVAGDWEIKRLQRMIVTSGTFRQATQSPNENAADKIDPDNTLLWRQNRRRLSAEQLRDSLLALSGRLNRQAGGPSVMPPVKQELIDLLYDPAQWQVTPDARQHDRRSVYLVAKRNLRLPMLEVFDQPDLQISCSRREASTHAPQSLELLNGELANDLARSFADRLRREAGDAPGQQIERAFLLAAGRLPTPLERDRSLAFLRQSPLEEFALAMFNLHAFLYID
jgi:hypothetical protein